MPARRTTSDARSAFGTSRAAAGSAGSSVEDAAGASGLGGSAEELRSANRLNGEGSSSGAAQPTTALSYVISQSGPCEGIRQTLEPAVVLCGRLGDCNCIVGHETLEGKLVENLLVSRVQFIMMRLGDELVVLDCWSVCGTRTVRRAAGKVLQSSKPGARATLLFGASETFTLEVAKEAKITFNPTDADVRAAAERASGHHGARQGSVTAQATVHESGSGSTIASAESSTRGSTLTIDTTLT